MFLSGPEMSLAVESLGRTSESHLLLRPRLTYGPLTSRNYADVTDSVGEVRAWSPEDVEDAAAWWNDVATGREPVNEGHCWFGGGVCFGSVTPHNGADVAVDVVILDDEHAPRPSVDIDYDGVAFVGDRGRPDDFRYVTVDTAAREVAAAAAWWQALLTA